MTFGVFVEGNAPSGYSAPVKLQKITQPIEAAAGARAVSPFRPENWKLRRDGLGLLQTLSIAEAWGLTQQQLAILLGTTVRTLQRWKVEANRSRMLEVSPDTAERMSYLLGISKGLTILFPTSANRVHWLKHSNTDPAFNGQSPLDRMLAGHVVDLFMVRHYLDGLRG